ncbi:MAG: IPT/TIG domain-containing protein [Acidobacteria bacterium]|nr:IPT/TIG domain-containing protein [Acidobacteriota bacterium]
MRKASTSLTPFVMVVLLCSAPISSAQSWSGSGDFVIDSSRPATPALVRITGNAGSDYFGVVSYTSSGGYIDLLANTTDPYDGIRPLDFEGTHAGRFEITATGAWAIEILPVSAAHSIVVPGAYAGSGDDVVALSGGTPNTANISGNAADRYFGVISYSRTGNWLDLLVNTTSPYSGTVIVPSTTGCLDVQAVGPWSINVNGVPCSASVGTFTRSFGDQGGSVSVYVGTQTGCAWDATSSVPWIYFTPNGRTGSGSTTMTVQPNYDLAARSGTVTIAGWTYTVDQAGYTDGPTITSVTSKKGTPGNPATIVGTDFAPQTASNTVKFGKYQAKVTKASSTKLTVTIPSKCRKGKSYQVTVEAYGETSNAVSFKVR